MSDYQPTLTRIKQRVEPNDIYYTPADLVKTLMQYVPIGSNDSLLDPFAGLGVWFDNYPPGNPKEWAEITRGRDFWGEVARADWLISNPPFSKLTAILERSCYLSRKGFAYLLPLNALSYSRLEKISRYGFEITSLRIFKNPVEWGIGFQMCFVVWSRCETGIVPAVNIEGERVRQAQLFSYGV